MPAIYLKSSRNYITIFFVAIAVFFGGMLLLHAASAGNRDKVATGFLVDLLITFPACYYFIVIRPLKKSNRRMLVVVTACCAIAYLVLPAHQRNIVFQVRKLVIPFELIFVNYTLIKIRNIYAVYKAQQSVFADPFFSLRKSLTAVMGDTLAVKVLASELAVLRYGLIFWKKERAVSTNTKTFTIHKESGYIAVWCILVFAMLVEVVAFHLLLLRWSSLAANIVSALTLYGLIFFIADLSAIIKRRVLVDDNTVVLRTGIRWRAVVGKDNILSVEKITNDYTGNETFLKGGILKTNGNVLIRFRDPVAVDSLYGQGKNYDAIWMSIDDADEFIAVLK